MPEQGRVSLRARHELVMSFCQEYVGASRAGRGKILDTLEQQTGYGRKYLIRLLSGKYKPHPRRKQRGRSYNAAFDDALRVIFRAHDGISPDRIHPNLLSLAQQLEARGELTLTGEVKEQLQRVSVSTLWRIRKRLCQDHSFLLPQTSPPERAAPISHEGNLLPGASAQTLE